MSTAKLIPVVEKQGLNPNINRAHPMGAVGNAALSRGPKQGLLSPIFERPPRNRRFLGKTMPELQIPIVDFLNQATDGIMASAIPDRKRRCMSRRSGQNGRIEKKGNVHYARFWLDVPGEAKRVYKSVRICPVDG